MSYRCVNQETGEDISEQMVNKPQIVDERGSSDRDDKRGRGDRNDRERGDRGADRGERSDRGDRNDRDGEPKKKRKGFFG